MAETTNIAQMAQVVSVDLFSEFLWKTTGSTNQNWGCEIPEHKRQTHPSDIVFFYDEPYSLKRTYVNCDLKSYARATITPGAISAAICALAQSLACMEISDDWRAKYVHDGRTPNYTGLLFVYNHDGEYDKDFSGILQNISCQDLSLPAGTQVSLFGPEQIYWLDNIRYEIIYMRGKGDLPPRESCRFHYPNLTKRTNVQPEAAKAAVIESLLGPWITLKYDAAPGKKPGYVVFYRGKGENSLEFLHLIDHLMHYQMINPEYDVTLRTIDADVNAPTIFERAIHEYIENRKGGEEIESQLKRINYKSIKTIRRRFSEVELGMSHV